MTMTVGGTSGLVFPDSSTQNTAATGFGFKNRIINGNMVIDQRNAGSSVTPSNTQYTLDRWCPILTQSSKLSVQQNAGSVTPPVGFTNYLGVTSLSAYSIVSGDIFSMIQVIEGNNIGDLAWGTANAKTVTLSFQVYSSLTGTFGGALSNNAQNRSYPFTYTVSSANTWTTVSITIAGDTSGTWLTNTSGGIVVRFGLGVGSTYSGTAGTWAGSNYYSATGATSVVGTNGATFYITGVQLEKGSTATSFDYRPYGTELALCQRYLPAWRSSSGNNEYVTAAYTRPTGALLISVHTFQVTPRVQPTGVSVNAGTGTMASSYTYDAAGTNQTTASFYGASLTAATISWAVTGAPVNGGTCLISTSSNNYILFNGCEL